MRDIKTLLEILLDQYENHKDSDVRNKGLCHAIKVLHESHGVFTTEERARLDTFIYEHRPNRWAGEDDFWWDMGVVYPRIKFLMRLMNRL